MLEGIDKSVAGQAMAVVVMGAAALLAMASYMTADGGECRDSLPDRDGQCQHESQALLIVEGTATCMCDMRRP